MTVTRFGAGKIPDGKFSSLLDVEAIVNQILATMVHDGTVTQLVVAQSLQWSYQCLLLKYTRQCSLLHQSERLV